MFSFVCGVKPTYVRVSNTWNYLCMGFLIQSADPVGLVPWGHQAVGASTHPYPPLPTANQHKNLAPPPTRRAWLRSWGPSWATLGCQNVSNLLVLAHILCKIHTIIALKNPEHPKRQAQAQARAQARATLRWPGPGLGANPNPSPGPGPSPSPGQGPTPGPSPSPSRSPGPSPRGSKPKPKRKPNHCSHGLWPEAIRF